MKWSKVGDWLKENAGAGTALVGSLLTGNVPGAIAAGTALVSSATGTDDPTEALVQLQNDPNSLLKLKELYYENEASVRQHLEVMTRLELEDQQKSHHETQETIRSGDNATDRFVRWTRPAWGWVSLIAGIYYALYNESPDVMILGMLLTIPFTYVGLRQVGKGIDSFTNRLRK